MQRIGQLRQQCAAQDLLHGTTSPTNSRSAKLQPRRPHHAPGVGSSRAWRACQVRPSGTRVLCLQEAWHANRCEVRRKQAARLGQLQTEFCRGAKADHSRSCLGHVVAMEDVSGCLQRSAPSHRCTLNRDAEMPASSMRGSFATLRAVSTRWTLRAQADSLRAGCGLGADGKLESKNHASPKS